MQEIESKIKDKYSLIMYVCVLGFSIAVKGHHDYGNSYKENI